MQHCKYFNKQQSLDAKSDRLSQVLWYEIVEYVQYMDISTEFIIF